MANGLAETNFGNWWVDRISTGTNDLIYYDANGDSVRINRWTDITFPSRPPLVRVAARTRRQKRLSHRASTLQVVVPEA